MFKHLFRKIAPTLYVCTSWYVVRSPKNGIYVRSKVLRVEWKGGRRTVAQYVVVTQKLHDSAESI